MRRLALAVLAAALLVPALAGAVAPKRTGTVLWRGDMEEGDLADWSRHDCGGNFSNPPNADAVPSTRAHTGASGAELSIAAPNGAAGARLFRWCEPRDRAVLDYTAWYFVPRAYAVADWFHLMQWKSTPPGGSPGNYNATVMVRVRTKPTGAMALGIERGVDTGGGVWDQDLAEVPVGRWFEVRARVVKGWNGDGRVVLWQDGVKLLDVPGINTARGGPDLQWAVVAYGDGISPTPVTIHVDDARIATP